MSKETNFFDLFERRIKLAIHTSGPARVLAFDEEKREADIELLFMTANSNGGLSKYPMIPSVPVMGMRYKVKTEYQAHIDGTSSTIQPLEEIEYVPFLKKGDVVFVVFAERALDNLQNTPFDPDSMRTHDVRDAWIVGVWGL